jgi:hypothetical protein
MAGKHTNKKFSQVFPGRPFGAYNLRFPLPSGTKISPTCFQLTFEKNLREFFPSLASVESLKLVSLPTKVVTAGGQNLISQIVLNQSCSDRISLPLVPLLELLDVGKQEQS